MLLFIYNLFAPEPYLSMGALMLVVWAYFIQKDELEYTVKNANDVLCWFDNMKNQVPVWYR